MDIPVLFQDADEGDYLPEQIVEDEFGNMMVVPESLLLDGEPTFPDLLRGSSLAMENLENDAPYADLY